MEHENNNIPLLAVVVISGLVGVVIGLVLMPIIKAEQLEVVLTRFKAQAIERGFAKMVPVEQKYIEFEWNKGTEINE